MSPGSGSRGPEADPHDEAKTLSAPGRIAALEDIDQYRVIELIGEGGMGEVYKAEQRGAFRRLVALKVIRPGLDTRTILARFDAERQALALMSHPNIARVFDGGTTKLGRPYFVMEYVAGEPITSYCDRRRLPIRARLELFAQVCDAVQHAHTKGIIHRDVKASNVLLSEVDGKAVPKVIDFGVAKAINQRLTEQTLFTETGRLVGTPAYSSPEQAEGSVDVDTRSDVYSLGVLLYELLTGALPFDPTKLRALAYGEMQRIIREVDPPRPSTFYSKPTRESHAAAGHRAETVEHLASTLRRELEWIPLFAMRKERERRYQTASELARDIQNYLDGKPLIAGPSRWGYRAQKAIKRNKPVFAAAAGIVLALLLGMAGTTWQTVRAERRAVEADEARREADKQRKEADKQREIAGDQLKLTKRELARSNTTGQFFTGILRGVDPAQAPNYDASLLLLMLSRAEERLRNEIHDPVERADLLRFLGNMYARWGKHEEAGELLADALDESTKAYRAAAEGEKIYNDYEVVRTLVAAHMLMSQWHLEAGNYTAALASARAAHELAVAELPASHPQRTATAVNLSAALQKANQLDEAGEILSEALEQMEADTDRYPASEWAVAKSNWATLLLARKDADAELAFAEAERAYREAGMHGTPAFANVIHNRADLLRQRKALQEALDLCQEANRIRRAAHRDPGHLDFAKGLNLLGSILIEMGRFEDAYAAIAEEFQIRLKTSPQGHQPLASAAARAGRLATQTGRAPEAVVWYRRAVEHASLDTDSPPESRHRQRLVALRRLGEALVNADEVAEAEQHLRECLTDFTGIVGRDPSRLNQQSLALTQLALAGALLRQTPSQAQRITEARTLLVACLEIFRGVEGTDGATYSPEHRRAQELLNELDQAAAR